MKVLIQGWHLHPLLQGMQGPVAQALEQEEQELVRAERVLKQEEQEWAQEVQVLERVAQMWAHTKTHLPQHSSCYLIERRKYPQQRL